MLNHFESGSPVWSKKGIRTQSLFYRANVVNPTVEQTLVNLKFEDNHPHTWSAVGFKWFGFQ